MDSMMIVGLIQNAGLLLASALLFDIFAVKWKSGENIPQKALVGLFLGCIGIVVMLSPWTFSPGIVFDTRSVLVGITGLFFGGIPTLITMVMTAAFRFYQGGIGAWTGVSVIVASGIIGFLWRRKRFSAMDSLSWGELLLLGLTIHVAMLALMLTLPWDIALKVLANISLPVLLIFPLGTALLGKLMVNRLMNQRVREALRESEARMQSIFRVAPSGIGVVADRVLKQVNKRMCEITGYSEEELIGQNVRMLYPTDEDFEYVGREKYIQIHDHGTGTVETRWLCKDGRIIDVLLSSTPLDMTDLSKGVTFTALDITERKRMEEALGESEQFLESVVENVPLMLFIKDAKNLSFVRFNRAGEELLGYSREELVGKNDYDFFPDEEAVFFTSKDREVLRDSKVVDTPEETIETKDRGQRILHTKKIPIFGKDGTPLYLLGISEDITERKRTEEALYKSKEQAEAANLAKSEFLANMSHEIRTPLNGVLGMLQILQESPLDDGQQEYLEAALNSGKSLTRLINDILDLSRIESGKMDIREEEFQIGEVISSTQGVFLNEALRKGLAGNYHIDPGLPSAIMGDSGRLRQILFNLVGNAVKFTTSGEVNVRAYPGGKEAGTDRFELCFEISDTGIGIPKDKLEMIYEPFSQVDGSYTRKFGGTGLGLSIVKRLVQLMDGELHVESEVDVGTTFRVRIPVRAVKGESAVEAKLSAAIAPPEVLKPIVNLRILLAEDDLSNQLVAKRMLAKQGHTVTCVATGKEALTALEKEKFDLILMDVQMPEMDGTEATMEIRKDERFKNLPIIALTAHAMSGDRERFLEAGMNAYLSKPIDMEELTKVLAGVIVK